MNLLAKAAIALVPGGLLILAVIHASKCRHRYGWASTRCTKCGHGERPHSWSGEPVRHRRTQEGGDLYRETGIEREARAQAAQDAEVAATITAMERREKFELVKQRVTSRFGGQR